MKDLPIKLGPLALLLTVISICMTVLAILTFTTARGDRNLASTYAQTVQERYDLEAEGQAFLAQLDHCLAETRSDPDWPFWNSPWCSPDWDLEQGEDGVCWATLERNGAVLRIGYVPTAEGYEIRAWRQERIWSEDTSMGNLWPGT